MASRDELDRLAAEAIALQAARRAMSHLDCAIESVIVCVGAEAAARLLRQHADYILACEAHDG